MTSVKKLGVVIPTLQKRLDYLIIAINSALDSPAKQVIIVCPSPPSKKIKSILTDKCEWVVADENLPESVNSGVRQLSTDIDFFTWIGDDDVLLPNSLSMAMEGLGETHLVVGKCNHIDARGKILWVQKPKKWRLNVLSLSLFTNPISQPGTIISRQAFQDVGGVSSEFPLAFDNDLFFRLIKRFGLPEMNPDTLASFRVHGDSLSKMNWKDALIESARIRLKNSPRALTPLVFVVDVLRIRANQVARTLGLARPRLRQLDEPDAAS